MLKLTARHARAIDALMNRRDTKAAAQTAGVSYATIPRWLALPDFIAALNSARVEATRQATRRLAGALDKSVTSVVYLAELAEDEAVRLRSAMAVATMLRELSEHGDFEECISALEAAQSAQAAGQVINEHR